MVRSNRKPAVSFVKVWMIAVFAVLLLGAASSVLAVSGASAQTPTTTTGTVPAETTTTTASGDEPTKGESFAALVAILGGIFVSVAVVWLVSRAHDIQARLAAASLARGGSVRVVTSSAGAGRELAPATPDTISITGPDQVAEDTAGEFTVDRAVTHPTWSVSGIGSFTQLLKDDDHTFLFTPHEQKADVKVKVTDGTKTGEKPVEILAAANPSFVLRVVVRNWGLVVVAVAIVFGAIALGVTGHLDGGNFVALVAPLAALLGVTAAVSERDGSGSAGGGASGGGSGGGAAGS